MPAVYACINDEDGYLDFGAAVEDIYDLGTLTWSLYGERRDYTSRVEYLLLWLTTTPWLG